MGVGSDIRTTWCRIEGKTLKSRIKEEATVLKERHSAELTVRGSK